MNKTSKIPGLPLDLLLDRLKTHGIPAASIGASAAAIAHLLSLRQQTAKQNEQEENTDELVIEVPEKTAESAGQYFWDAPLVVGSSLAGGTLGYAIVNSILQKRRQQQLNKELDNTKNQYSSYLSKDISSDSKEANFPCISGLVFSLTEKINTVPAETHRKQAVLNLIKVADPGKETIGTLFTSLPTLGALLAGIVTHNMYYNKEKNFERGIQQEEANNSQIAPRSIKIVTKKNTSNNQLEQGNDIDVNELLGNEKKSSLFAGVEIARAFGNKDRTQENKSHKPKTNKLTTRKNPIISKDDIQELDKNTLLMLTDSGNVNVDALDPNALAVLEKHKENILRSLAAGLDR